ncbi:threonine dehydratase [Sporosarcina sp. P21c]|uniref:threonine ammonia-lyase IlvA n=2 Tax=Caryophanaceae TaxID=186818 RepID=UPI000A16476E|nr:MULTISPECIES: threonine ammonia-lyase IlvA [Sporosarcina]ARJ37776.1 threonine dehydratase [Sporosarcina ureae]PIC66228.1 threonine dehydratase [Sporosarcina sp. P16a]PIC82905.1 threonine dehydratase [Sporosarcina sp. P1]PIC90135.1 threonine dehydratase [Sporosarcina sp. P21c]PIC91878.1 threonine dehydratase [Sporosarcina sp. P25]
MKVKKMETPSVQVEDILIANQLLKDIVAHTPLQKNDRLSEKYDCHVYIKREDLQHVRSFKLRGAYYKMKRIETEARKKGIVCASAGNHAQGVAFACAKLDIDGKIFMPQTTPRQKVNMVKMFGRDRIEIILVGDTFDDCFERAVELMEKEKRIFIHPFNDKDIIAGQGTVAVEIMNDIEEPIDYVFASIGGGGLMSGISTYIKNLSPHTKMIGAEPAGAASMKASIDAQKVVPLATIDKFVDGAAVKCVGNLNYDICNNYLENIVSVPEGKVCTAILDLYNEHAIIAEPAGALPIAALDFYKNEIKGKCVVCVISGGNNDIGRMQEIKEKSMIYEGLLYYFLVDFPQRAGALRQFLDGVLGPDDDITMFEYTKKNNKESGPGLVGIEIKHKEDYNGLIARMEKNGFPYKEVNKDSTLFGLLI